MRLLTWLLQLPEYLFNTWKTPYSITEFCSTFCVVTKSLCTFRTKLDCKDLSPLLVVSHENYVTYFKIREDDDENFNLQYMYLYFQEVKLRMIRWEEWRHTTTVEGLKMIRPWKQTSSVIALRNEKYWIRHVGSTLVAITEIACLNLTTFIFGLCLSQMLFFCMYDVKVKEAFSFCAVSSQSEVDFERASHSSTYLPRTVGTNKSVQCTVSLLQYVLYTYSRSTLLGILFFLTPTSYEHNLVTHWKFPK